MKKNKNTAFRFRCPKCRKAEMDRFLKACFSCWLDMSQDERRSLQVQAGLLAGAPMGRGTPPGDLKAVPAAQGQWGL